MLRDEGEAFAHRLRAGGVSVALRRYRSMTHGFLRYHNTVDVAAATLSALADDLRRFCGQEG